MWFIQIICAPFKMVILLFKGIGLLITGIKIVAPHVSDGFDKTNEYLIEINRDLSHFNESQIEARKTKHIKAAKLVEDAQAKLDESRAERALKAQEAKNKLKIISSEDKDI